MPWGNSSAIRSAWAWTEPPATSCKLAMPEAVESGRKASNVASTVGDTASDVAEKARTTAGHVPDQVGMDPLAQAFAYYDFDETQGPLGRLVYTQGVVQPKYFINSDNFIILSPVCLLFSIRAKE